MDKGHSHKKCQKKKERGIQELANVNNKLRWFQSHKKRKGHEDSRKKCHNQGF